MPNAFVSCRQSVASIGHMAFWVFYVCYFLLLGTFSYRLLMREEMTLDPKYWDCSGWAPVLVDLSVVVIFLCVLPRQALDRLYKKPTLRVSPKSWSLTFWPEAIKHSTVLKPFLWLHESDMARSVTVHGAKVWFPAACMLSHGNIAPSKVLVCPCVGVSVTCVFVLFFYSYGFFCWF